MITKDYFDDYFSESKQPLDKKRFYFNVESFMDYAKELSEGAAPFLRYKDEKELKIYL